MITLIPAIDIIDGKCMRLTKGDYTTQKVYNEDPVAVAREFEQAGLKRLHIVDLDGACSKHVVNHRVLEKIATSTSMTIDFGGGIKTDEDLHIAFESGAALITIGSIAVTDEVLFTKWLLQYGAECFILGADVKDGAVSINGWKENSHLELIPFLEKYLKKGISQVLCTDVSKDGMLEGPSLPLYQEILEKLPQCGLIASGGVSKIQDFIDLNEAGVVAVVFGKALYEGRILLSDLSKWLESC